MCIELFFFSSCFGTQNYFRDKDVFLGALGPSPNLFQRRPRPRPLISVPNAPARFEIMVFVVRARKTVCTCAYVY